MKILCDLILGRDFSDKKKKKRMFHETKKI